MNATIVNTEEVIASFDETMLLFTNQLKCFDNSNINVIPFEGSWTGGQLAAHIILSNQGLAGLLSIPVKETERAPDEKLPMLREIFLDFTTKLKAPANVLPEAKIYVAEEMADRFEQITNAANDSLQSADLTQTCDSDLPFFGYLTRLEVTCFMTYHTQRHTRQLQNIWKTVRNKW